MADGEAVTPWKRGVSVAKDIGEYAKLVALMLTVIRFIGVYFPWAKRQFEPLTNPAAWYFIGGVYGDRFGHYDYQSPLWDEGPIQSAALGQLPGNIVVTTKSDEPHNGRSFPGARGAQITVVPANSCLYVRGTQIVAIPQPKTGGPQQAVWAKAQRVTC